MDECRGCSRPLARDFGIPSRRYPATSGNVLRTPTFPTPIRPIRTQVRHRPQPPLPQPLTTHSTPPNKNLTRLLANTKQSGRLPNHHPGVSPCSPTTNPPPHSALKPRKPPFSPNSAPPGSTPSPSCVPSWPSPFSPPNGPTPPTSPSSAKPASPRPRSSPFPAPSPSTAHFPRPRRHQPHRCGQPHPLRPWHPLQSRQLNPPHHPPHPALTRS